MSYFDRAVPKARTIETLEIFDVLEIVVRDFQRYNVPDGEIAAFLADYVFPLKKAADELILKYNPK